MADFEKLSLSARSNVCFFDFNDQGTNERKPVLLLDESKISLKRFNQDLKTDKNASNFLERMVELREMWYAVGGEQCFIGTSVNGPWEKFQEVFPGSSAMTLALRDRGFVLWKAFYNVEHQKETRQLQKTFDKRFPQLQSGINEERNKRDAAEKARKAAEEKAKNVTEALANETLVRVAAEEARVRLEKENGELRARLNKLEARDNPDDAISSLKE